MLASRGRAGRNESLLGRARLTARPSRLRLRLVLLILLRIFERLRIHLLAIDGESDGLTMTWSSAFSPETTSTCEPKSRPRVMATSLVLLSESTVATCKPWARKISALTGRTKAGMSFGNFQVHLGVSAGEQFAGGVVHVHFNQQRARGESIAFAVRTKLPWKRAAGKFAPASGPRSGRVLRRWNIAAER